MKKKGVLYMNDTMIYEPNVKFNIVEDFYSNIRDLPKMQKSIS